MFIYSAFSYAAARAAATSFCPQEVYLVEGFLSFPVSFLQKDISVSVSPATDKKDVVSQVEPDKHIFQYTSRSSQERAWRMRSGYGKSRRNLFSYLFTKCYPPFLRYFL
jgi:hypothetical protein